MLNSMLNQDPSIYSAMQTDRPYKTYRKTVLGQVYVEILNPFSGNLEGVILKGKGNEETTMVDLWSEKEDAFFKRRNKKNIEGGFVQEYKRPEVVELTEEERYNTLSDEELNTLLSKKYLALQAGINKMTSPAPVIRLIEMAKDQEKSEKIINLLTARLSEIQE